MITQTFSSNIRRKEMEAVLTCMVNETIGPGDMNKRLISQAKEFFDVEGAVAVRSPAIALKFALDCLAMEKGSKIAISPLAPLWHLSAVTEYGLEPVFLDVDPQSGVISREELQKAATEGVTAVILYAPFGGLSDSFDAVNLGLVAIEDISESGGAFFYKQQNEDGSYEEKIMAGGVCPYTIVGMEVRDSITAGGGALLLARSRRDSAPLRSRLEEAPLTDILPDINCALGFVQLREFPKNQEVCKKIEIIFAESLLNTNHSRLQQVPLQEARNVERSVYSFPVIINGSMQSLTEFTKKKEIQVATAFEDRIIAKMDLPECKNARALYLRTALFPLYFRLSEKSIEKISKTLQFLP